MYSNLLFHLKTVFLIFLFCLSLVAQTVSTLTKGFNANGDISINKKGDIFVSDFGSVLGNANGADIYKVKKDGSFQVFASGFVGASGNAFDSHGFLYQSNIAIGTVSKVSPNGKVTTFASENITSPVGITADNEDNIYVTNCRTPGWLTKISPSGETSIFASSSLMKCPNGLTIDDAGNLYTCNFGDGNIIKITPNGEVSKLAFVPGNNNGHLIFANGLLYVVGRSANQIFTVSLSGDVNKLAGAGIPGNGQRGKKDGTAESATFSLPNGIDVSPDGDTLYISDKVDILRNALNPSVIRIITGINPNATDIQNRSPLLEYGITLDQNYPNPFNPNTIISYFINKSAAVNVNIYDVLGKKISTLINKKQDPGNHIIEFKGNNYSTGTYYYKLTVDNYSISKKMLLIK